MDEYLNKYPKTISYKIETALTRHLKIKCICNLMDIKTETNIDLYI